MAAAFIMNRMNTLAGEPVVGPVVCCGMTMNSITAFVIYISVCMVLFLQMVPLVMPLLQTLTEQEADNFGIFLREILQSVMGWWVSHRDDMQSRSFCLKWKC